MAQALADASAEAISNMGLEGLRRAVERGDPAGGLSGSGAGSIGTAADREPSAAQLRVILAQRARECRIEIFGGAGLGSLDVSRAAPDDTPDTDDESRPKKRRRSSNHTESETQVRSSSSSVVPTRLSKRTREYMVDALQRWCTKNPGAIMPSKEEKQSLAQRCSDSTGEEVAIRHLEYWFWQRNKVHKQTAAGRGSKVFATQSQQKTLRSAGASSQDIDENKTGQNLEEQDEAAAKRERRRVEQQAAQIAARYLRHQQETPLYRLLHGRGSALSPPSLRQRPVDSSLPMVVVHPLPTPTENENSVAGCNGRLDFADAAAESSCSTINLCERMVREDTVLMGHAYGSTQIAATSHQSVFCPRFDVNVQYEATLTEQYLKGKAIRAARQSDPLSAPPCDDSSDDEPATPATWRSSGVFLEPPPRSELTRYPRRSRDSTYRSRQKRQRLDSASQDSVQSNGRIWHKQPCGRPPANKYWDGRRNCWADNTPPSDGGENAHNLSQLCRVACGSPSTKAAAEAGAEAPADGKLSQKPAVACGSSSTHSAAEVPAEVPAGAGAGAVASPNSGMQSAIQQECADLKANDSATKAAAEAGAEAPADGKLSQKPTVACGSPSTHSAAEVPAEVPAGAGAGAGASPNSGMQSATQQECADLKANDSATTATATLEIQTASHCLSQRTDNGTAESRPHLSRLESHIKNSKMDPNWKQVLDTAGQRTRDAMVVSQVVGLVCETVSTSE